MSLVTLGLALLLSTAAQSEAAQSEPAKSDAAESDDEPSAAPPSKRPRPPADQARGLDPPVVGALQLAAACATYVVALPTLSVASYACPLASCAFCLAPAAVGYVGTWVGDRFGAKRAPAVWPIVAAYGGMVLSGLGMGVLYYGVLSGGNQLFLLGGAAGVLAGFAASAFGVPIAYAITAEEKLPGDDGTGPPGLLVPGHAGDRAERPAPSTNRPKPSRPPKAPLPDLPPPPLLEPHDALRVMRF